MTEPSEAAETGQSKRDSAAGKSLLRLSLFDWAGFVDRGFFLTMASGAVATGLVLTQPESLPAWMISSTPLLFLSLVFAFTRVWKTAREEGETTNLWEQFGEVVSPRGGGMEHVRDVVFEIPYLFSIAFLPVSVVSLQTFAVTLLVFYLSDNYYNLALARGVGGDNSIGPFAALRWLKRLGTAIGRRLPGAPHSFLMLLGAALESSYSTVVPQPNSIDRLVLVRFFGRRARLDTIAIWLLVTVLAFAMFGPRELAAGIGFVAVATLFVMELLVEPFRVLGVQYEAEGEGGDGRLLWAVPHRARLDAESSAALTTIHQAAFPPAEQQITAERMLNPATADESLMLLTEDARVIGYLFLEARPRRQVVFFWYLAIDKTRRAQGMGTFLVEQALDVVRERWPTCRAVFLETARPSAEDDDASDDARRVRFYRKLGFFWVQGLNYAIPAADGSSPLKYDPMFYLLHDEPAHVDKSLPGYVKAAALEMARDNFVGQPTNPLWVALKASTDQMRIVAPESEKL
jgi:GNAT superfamily N-acetyltransferase